MHLQVRIGEYGRSARNDRASEGGLMEQHQTFCRYCHAYCAMVATVEDGVVESVKPDTSNPIYGGYTCIKGRQNRCIRMRSTD